MHPRNALVAETRAVDQLSSIEIERMHLLLNLYYENHPRDQFVADLMEKNHVILLKDRKTRVIQGFSTLLQVPLNMNGKQVWGVFSGDTVLNKSYWGSAALGIAFLTYLWKFKLQNPLKPVYWFLISKGYKTYMIMANNFLTHYPRYERPTPVQEKKIMDAFYGKKFGHLYSSELGLMIPKGPACHLKGTVADITEEHLKNPRIRFFQEKNPDWIKGVELCCIAEMTITMPISYSIKKFVKGLFR